MYHHGIAVNCVEKQTFSYNFTNFVLKSFWTIISAFPRLHVPLHEYILTQNYAQYKVECINRVHLENRLESVSGFTGPVRCMGLNQFNIMQISKIDICYYVRSWQIESTQEQQHVLTSNSLTTQINLTCIT